MKLYKLTDEHNETYGHTKWGENVSHTATGTGGLCSSGVIHAYTDPLLAAFFNPIHGDFKSPRLWEAESGDELVSDGTKVGVKTLTTVRVVDLPEISTTQRVEIAIRCALIVYHNPDFETWANNWLSGKDRTEEAAAAAMAVAAMAVAAAAEWTAVAAWAAMAARAARAAEAARAAAKAAAAEWTTEAAKAAEAARAAAAAAEWTTEAAEAAEAQKDFDVLSIIKKVVNH
jgi:hypothetical protein